MAVQYVGSTKWTAVPVWATGVKTLNDHCRQSAAVTAPAANAAGSERVFRCTTPGTSGASEPTWNLTKGATTTDGTVTWTEVTGQSGIALTPPQSVWAAPHFRMTTAFAWMVAGDDMAVHENHDETRATAMTMASPGTAAAPCKVICINEANTARALTAKTTAGAGTGSLSLTFSGFCYSYGVTYFSGAITAPGIQFGLQTAPWHWIIEKGAVRTTGTVAFDINVGQISGTVQGQLLELIDSNLGFTATGQTLNVPGQLIWRGGAIIAGVQPDILFSPGGTWGQGDVICEGVDFSTAGSGKTLIQLQTGWRRYRFVNCKTATLVTQVAVGNLFTSAAAATLVGAGGSRAELINVGSGDTNYTYLSQTFQGTVAHETTVIRSGGASDGTTAIGRKMVASQHADFFFPLTMTIEFWNEIIGVSRTLKVPVLADSAVAMTDADVWMEAQFLGTSGATLESRTSDRLADFTYGTAAEQLPDASTWTTTGVINPLKYTLSVSCTPQEKGPIRVTVCLAKASTTIYVDPLVDVS